ncbi:MAG: 2OG-Fe(II) oxygenase [Pseudomonadota bacterium]
MMKDILNLASYPIDQPESDEYKALAARCQSDLANSGLCDLPDFMHPQVARRAAQDLAGTFKRDAFKHARTHNIYFKKSIPGLPADHPALARLETANRTLCTDQVGHTPLRDVYDWPPLHRFLADALGKTELHVMDDPIAGLNVMAYAEGQALNWHFDRSEYTTTLLLQDPVAGGAFQYRSDLRTDTDPNYDGVAHLLQGRDPEVHEVTATPGTLTVFRGKNTAHRVTPVQGTTDRVIAVFCYYEQPGVAFSREERIGFYGRAQ